MDCRTALEILEVVRPDSDDLRDPELASASAHLGSCPRCKASFRSRQNLDRAIGRLMRDVPVPSGLKQRLLVDLDVPATGESPVRVSRRRWFRVAASSAVCLIAGVVAWQIVFRQEDATISLAELQRGATARSAVSQAILDPGELPDFDGNFTADPPAGWSSSELSIGEGPKGFQPDGRDRRMLALYRFHLQTRRGGPVRGAVLVVPAQRVTNPPTATSFARATGHAKYVDVAGSECVSVAWTEGELVYVAFVPADALQSLKQALRVSPV